MAATTTAGFLRLARAVFDAQERDCCDEPPTPTKIPAAPQPTAAAGAGGAAAAPPQAATTANQTTTTTSAHAAPAPPPVEDFDAASADSELWRAFAAAPETHFRSIAALLSPAATADELVLAAQLMRGLARREELFETVPPAARDTGRANVLAAVQRLVQAGDKPAAAAARDHALPWLLDALVLLAAPEWDALGPAVQDLLGPLAQSAASPLARACGWFLIGRVPGAALTLTQVGLDLPSARTHIAGTLNAASAAAAGPPSAEQLAAVVAWAGLLLRQEDPEDRNSLVASAPAAAALVAAFAGAAPQAAASPVAPASMQEWFGLQALRGCGSVAAATKDLEAGSVDVLTQTALRLLQDDTLGSPGRRQAAEDLLVSTLDTRALEDEARRTALTQASVEVAFALLTKFEPASLAQAQAACCAETLKTGVSAAHLGADEGPHHRPCHASDWGANILHSLSCVFGGPRVFPLVSPIIRTHMADDDWRRRFGALKALGAVTEGASQELWKELPVYVPHAITLLGSDAEPAVRSAAADTLGKIVCDGVGNDDDLELEFEDTYGAEVLVAVTSALHDSDPMVATQACSTLPGMFESMTDDLLEIYKESLIAQLGHRLFRLQRAEERMCVISALASLIGCLPPGTAVQECYPMLMPVYLLALDNAIAAGPSPAASKLRLLLLESITCLGEAAGRRFFGPDLPEIMRRIKLIPESRFEAVTSSLPEENSGEQQLLMSWSRLARTLGNDFVQHLPDLFESLLPIGMSADDIQAAPEAEGTASFALVSRSDSESRVTVKVPQATVESGTRMMVVLARHLANNLEQPGMEHTLPRVLTFLCEVSVYGPKATLKLWAEHILPTFERKLMQEFGSMEVMTRLLRTLASCILVMREELLVESNLNLLIDVVTIGIALMENHCGKEEASKSAAELTSIEHLLSSVALLYGTCLADKRPSMLQACHWIFFMSLRVWERPLMPPSIRGLLTVVNTALEKCSAASLPDKIDMVAKRILECVTHHDAGVRARACFGASLLASHGDGLADEHCVAVLPVVLETAESTSSHTDPDVHDAATYAYFQLSQKAECNVPPAEALAQLLALLPILRSRHFAEAIHVALLRRLAAGDAVLLDDKALPGVLRALVHTHAETRFADHLQPVLRAVVIKVRQSTSLLAATEALPPPLRRWFNTHIG